MEGGPDAALGDLEDAMLGGVEELVDIRRRLVGARGDLGRDRGEAAQDGFLAHDPRIVRDIRRGRHDRRQLGDIRGAADHLELAAGAQRVAQRDRIDRLAAVGEIRHRAEDLAMRLAVEIFGGYGFERKIDRLVIEQDRAQHRLFGLEILRRNAP